MFSSFPTRSEGSTCDWRQDDDGQMTPDLKWRLNRTIMTLRKWHWHNVFKATEYAFPSTALNIMASIEWPCWSEPIVQKINPCGEGPLPWLKFLWRDCMEIWSRSCDPKWQAKYRNSDEEDKTNISPPLSKLLSPFPPWTICSGHENYDKWRWCGMCSLQQTFSFPLWRNASNWYVLSHQYHSLMVFTVNVITVDLIKVCIQRPNQTHSWSESLTGG